MDMNHAVYTCNDDRCDDIVWSLITVDRPARLMIG